MLRLKLLVLTWILVIPSYCQEKSISGVIMDSISLEKLIGANVLDEVSGRGVIADKEGYFRLVLPKSQIEAFIRISYVGYDNKYLITKVLEQDIIEIKLVPWKDLSEVIITAPKRESMSNMVKLNHITINAMPQLFGETDFLRTLQYYPGVLPSDESKNSLNVRGGTPDQNLILVEGVPTFYLYHLGNLSSAFNTDIINDITFSKGGFDAKFGGRLSSIIDVSMKEGNKDHLSGGFQIGMLTSRLNLQGPIVKEKTSFILSFRAFYSPILKLLGSPISYGFQDYFGKVHHVFSKKSNISGIVFATNDLLKAGLLSVDETQKKSNRISTGWSNALYSIDWSYRLSSSVTLKTQAYRTSYQFDHGFNIDQKMSKYKMNSTNKAMIQGLDLHAKLYQNKTTSFGLQLKQYLLNSGEGSFQDLSKGEFGIDTLITGFIQRPVEGVAFFSQETRITNRLRGTWGVRTSFFHSGKLYPRIEPRLNLELQIKKGAGIVLSYSKMTQPLHLVSLNYSDMPSDFWMASNSKFEPESSSQFSMGLNIEFSSSSRIDITGYHKRFKNLIYINQTIPILLGDFIDREGQFYLGTGQSTGIELIWRHEGESLNGWVSGTVSKTTRCFDEINYGQPFLSSNDRPLFIATNWVYNLDKGINFSLQWFFGSGKPITLPEQKYALNGTQFVIFDYSELNSYRMKPIHRLDIGFNYSIEKQLGKATWNFSIINVYNRQNPFYYTIQLVKSQSSNQYELKTEQTSFFFFMPSLSYRFEFN